MFKNLENLHEAALHIRKLQQFAQDLGTQQKLDSNGAVDRIEDRASDIENKLLEEFSQATRETDYEAMRKCAQTLTLFGNGLPCRRRYVGYKFIDFHNSTVQLQQPRKELRHVDDESQTAEPTFGDLLKAIEKVYF